jgi:putative FmdB family regulatory protein
LQEIQLIWCKEPLEKELRKHEDHSMKDSVQTNKTAEEVNMPNYGFICEGCNHSFDKLLSIQDRELPLNECCPQCGENKIIKDFGSMRQSLTADTNLNANTATGGRWNELMSRMKGGLAKRYHSNLDAASANTGRSWLG